MELKKSFESMRQRLASDVAQRLTKVNIESLLGTLGLMAIKRTPSMTLPLLAAFGSGVAVGALFAPTTGKDLRAKLALLVGKLKLRAEKHDATREMSAGGVAIESPYDKAKSEREAAGSNGRKGEVRMTAAGVPESPAT